MRLLAAAAAFCLSAAAGVRGAWLFSLRARTLDLLVLLLERLGTELRFSCAPLPDMLFRLSAQPPFDALVLLSVCCENLRAGVSLPAAFDAGVSASGRTLRPWEQTRLRQLGSLLGATDLSGQQQVLTETIAFLEDCHSKAVQQQDSAGKLCRACGLCCGTVLFILIL